MALFFGVAFFVNGVIMPFFPVLLSAKGLSGREIAIVLATPQVIRVMLMPVVSSLSDRARDRRLVMAGVVALTLFSAVVLGFLGQPPLIIVFGSLMLMFSYCIGPLADAFAILLERGGQGEYGRMRLWGSATFIGGNLVGGFALELSGADAIYLIIVASFAVTLIATALIPPPKPAEGEADHVSVGLLRMPAFLAVVFGHAINQASHAALFGFGALTWQARGYSDVTIGVFWAIAVIAEIMLFAFAARLPRTFRPTSLMMAGAIVATARWVMSSADLGLIATSLLQVSHAATYALAHIGLTRFIRTVVPVQRTAAAQGAYVVFNGLGMGLSTALAGHFWPILGASGYLVMTAFSMAGLATLAVARRFIDDLPAFRS
jgi:PPP family 3-phenylpropionic acid transporter